MCAVLSLKIFDLHGFWKERALTAGRQKDYGGLHPTQKPIALLKDLIKTYSNHRDRVLDFTMGSGSTIVACIETGREGIGIELDEKYFKIAKERIEKIKQQGTQQTLTEQNE